MRALLRSEWLRARSRRLVPMVLVGCVLLIVVGTTIGAVESHKPSATQLSAAQANYDQNLARCKRNPGFRPKDQVPNGFSSVEDFCNRNVELYVDTGMKVSDLVNVIQGSALFTILIAVLLASSLGGADWTSGTMTTLLTWESRRTRVLLTRAVVVSVFVFVITILIQGLLVGAFAAGASLRGWTGGTPPGFAEDVVRIMVRVSTMAVAFGLVALSIAMIGRSTVAALGVLVGYLALFEGVVAGFAQGTQDKMLVRAAGVVVSRQPIYDYRGNYRGIPPVLLGIGEAWVVVGFYVIALVGLALLVFRARDVS